MPFDPVAHVVKTLKANPSLSPAFKTGLELAAQECAMSESKHTPAPWHVEGRGLIIGGPDGVWIATAKQTIDGPEREANARLIAAAPELLAALGDMRLYFGNPKREEWLNDAAFGEALRVDERARAAIAKATGGA